MLRSKPINRNKPMAQILCAKGMKWKTCNEDIKLFCIAFAYTHIDFTHKMNDLFLKSILSCTSCLLVLQHVHYYERLRPTLAADCNQRWKKTKHWTRTKTLARPRINNQREYRNAEENKILRMNIKFIYKWWVFAWMWWHRLLCPGNRERR